MKGEETQPRRKLQQEGNAQRLAESHFRKQKEAAHRETRRMGHEHFVCLTGKGRPKNRHYQRLNR